MYQNYIFDFYGTLVDIRTNESKPYLWKKMSEFYASLGAVYTAPQLKAEFRRLEEESLRESLWKQEQSEQAPESATVNPDYAEANLREVFAALYRLRGVSCDENQARLTAIFFRTLSRQMLCTFDGVPELLKELKARGKSVYLLSNAQTDFTRPEIAMMGLEPYFDGIFISSEQGVKKPAPVFFQRLLDQFGLKPSESIMIGNDESADIKGAEALGMDSLYLHTAISPKEYGKASPTYRVMDGDFRKIRDLILR